MTSFNIKLIQLLLIFDTIVHLAIGIIVQVSNPFDPFRLECPNRHGIIKLTVQRIESVGGVRSDQMISSYCESLAKLFPSPRDGTSPNHDEKCRWTTPEKIPGAFDLSSTCKNREYVSGIVRQEINQYGFLCCSVKDRKRGKCETTTYPLPTAENPDVIISSGSDLLSGLGFKDGKIIAEHCDFNILTQKEIDQEFIAEAKAKLDKWFEADLKNRTLSIVAKTKTISSKSEKKPEVKPILASPPDSRRDNRLPAIKVTNTVNQFQPKVIGPPSITPSFAQRNSFTRPTILAPQFARVTPRPVGKPATVQLLSSSSKEKVDQRKSVEKFKSEERINARPPSILPPTIATTSTKRSSVVLPSSSTSGRPLPRTTPIRTSSTTSSLRPTSRRTTFPPKTESSTTTTTGREFTTLSSSSTFETTVKINQSSLRTTTSVKTATASASHTFSSRSPTTARSTPSTTVTTVNVTPSKRANSTVAKVVTTIARPVIEKSVTTQRAITPTTEEGDSSDENEIVRPSERLSFPRLPLHREDLASFNSLQTGQPDDKSINKGSPSLKNVSPKSVISVSKSIPSATTTNDENDVVYVDRDFSSTKKPTTDKQSDSAEYYYYYEDGQPASTKPTRSTIVTKTTTTAKTSTITPIDRSTFISVPITGSTTTTAAGTPKTLTTTKAPQTSRQQTNKVVCDTRQAAISSASGLVIACGQGTDIWSPPRCPKETFCMESANSNFRVCCSAEFAVV